MRDKIILIRGQQFLAKAITIGEFERINADHVVLIAGLKFPESLPADLTQTALNPNAILREVHVVMDHWKATEQTHFVYSEYASMVLNRGRQGVRVVEGKSLLSPWFYESVKALHRNCCQVIVNVEMKLCAEAMPLSMSIDGQEMPWQEGVERLKPPHWLG